MAVSNVTIVNQALNHLGVKTITSLSDDSKAARVASQFFESTRDALLELHPWSFATQRQALAESAETNLTNYYYMYALPTDPWCLKPRSFVGYATTPWISEGRYLYTNLADAELIYTAQIEDPRWFPANFVRALGYQLAIDMAYQMTGGHRQDLQGPYQRQLALAMGSDIEGSEYIDQGGYTWNQGRHDA